MGEPKPLASLTSGLLARKGQAAPAMRRQSMMISAPDAGVAGQHNPLEDLGWNDMGEEQAPVRQATGLSPMPAAAPAPAAPLMPVATPAQHVLMQKPPVVLQQQEELERELNKPFEAEDEPEVSEEFEAAEVVAEVPAPVEPEILVPVAVAPSVVVPVAQPRDPVVRAAPGSKGKAAFTLRLDGDRHLKLRLVCAINHRSAQQIVTRALDEFLAKQPSVEELMAGSGVVN
jgi:hypothetical protein